MSADPVQAAAAVSVSATQLAHRYAPGRGLGRLDFSFDGPGVVAVTGSNGSGKSTLLRIVAGLLQPSAGRCEVTVGGRTLSTGTRRDAVGFASPDLAFYGELTVLENLAFAAEARGGPAPDLAPALDAVGLSARGGDRVRALSTGMHQRLRVAFALLHRPALLLLDEPGSHLDDEGRAVIDALIERERHRALVLLATNDEREARLGDRHIALRPRGLGDPA